MAESTEKTEATQERRVPGVPAHADPREEQIAKHLRDAGYNGNDVRSLFASARKAAEEHPDNGDAYDAVIRTALDKARRGS